jgi:hypothetical protein
MSRRLDVGKALALVSKAQEVDTNAAHHPRYEAWRMRVQGYSAPAIAAQLGVSVVMAYKYLEWVKTEHPEIVVQDFLQITLERIETQYLQLEPARLRNDVMAHRVSKELMDMEAKLLGMYTVKVEHSQKITFSVDGVDMDKV